MMITIFEEKRRLNVADAGKYSWDKKKRNDNIKRL